ncbi:MAG: hypothetical protein J6O18_00855, partial [Bacilli bacterium]|nr:hypothetical protein [Bacilli bacterium]
IASDFTEEYDFTSIPDYKPLRREQPVEQKPEDLPSEDTEEESPGSQILPNFLKGKLGNKR